MGAVLDQLNVPTPQRIEVSRDGGPDIDGEVQKYMSDTLGIKLGGKQPCKTVTLRGDGKAIIIDGQVLEKPFVEKPVSGEDHNVYIYFREGGGRRLFRKASKTFFYLSLCINTLLTAFVDRLETNRVNLIRVSFTPGWMDRTYTKNSSTSIIVSRHVHQVIIVIQQTIRPQRRTSKYILLVQSTPTPRRASPRL